MADFKELREADKARTQGEWTQCGADRGGCPCGQVWSVPADFVVACTNAADEGTTVHESTIIANARFLALCSRDVPKLLAERDAALDALAEANARCGGDGHAALVAQIEEERDDGIERAELAEAACAAMRRALEPAYKSAISTAKDTPYKTADADAIRFPERPRPVYGKATRRQIWRSRLRGLIGRLANRIGLAGAVAPVVIEDALTGQRVEVRVSAWFTTISINGRDYYFRRFSGQFDGTGMGCSASSPRAGCRAASIHGSGPSRPHLFAAGRIPPSRNE